MTSATPRSFNQIHIEFGVVGQNSGMGRKIVEIFNPLARNDFFKARDVNARNFGEFFQFFRARKVFGVDDSVYERRKDNFALTDDESVENIG